MITSKCEYCGNEKQYKSQSRVKKFCSQSCFGKSYSEKSRSKHKNIKCKQCGVEFKVSNSSFDAREKNHGVKYCSRKCTGEAFNKKVTKKCKNCGNDFETKSGIYCSTKCCGLDKTKKYLEGEKRVEIRDGYRWVYVGRGKMITEHRLIMEKHIGRKIRRDEAVHHINLIRDDNRLSNLVLMTSSEHSKLHAELRKQKGLDFFGREGKKKV